jgi:hypothetical protein
MRTLMNPRLSQVIVLVSLLWVAGLALSLAVPSGFVVTAHADKAAGTAKDNPCAAKANPCAPKADAGKAKANPCAPNANTGKANPCAPKANPCAPKASAGAAKANPCAAKKR